MKFSKYLDKISVRVSKVLPMQLLGREDELRRLIYKVSGDEADFGEIEKQRIELSKRYVAVVCIFLILMVFFLANIFINRQEIVFEKDGKQYVSRSLAGELPKSLELVVKGESKREKLQKNVSFIVNPKGYIKKKQAEEEIRLHTAKKKNASEELKLKLYMIGAQDDKNYIELPKRAGSIKRLSWSSKKDRSYLIILFSGIVGLACVYTGRYEKLKKSEKKAMESVEQELVDFFNKLVLLINAGMVFTSAFEKTVEYAICSNSKSYFYNELAKISKKIKESNASIIIELKKFSKRTENKEFIRIVNVISDNINRGTELVKAMQTESELLAYQRRKTAEEKARIAETKLVIPLALQLLSLILITLAPAMLDM